MELNGVVESLINSVRKALDASVFNYTHTQLTYEQWATILSEVTYLINSRPLFPDGNPEDFNCISGNNLLYPYGQTFVVQTPDEEIINLCNMLQIAEKQVTMFWDTWLHHIPPQLLLPNKWFRARDNLKEDSAGNLYKRPIHKLCLIATKEELESGLQG